MKILLLLQAGITLALTSRPDVAIRVIKELPEEWRRINRKSLQKAITQLYRSQMVEYEEQKDGSVVMTLAGEGEKRILRYQISTMKLKRPVRWDGKWRLVLFDIPERVRKGREALSAKLKDLGFHPIQKSVFIYPHECKDEIDFIVEFFELKPYVRFLVVMQTDIDLELKHRFHL